MSRNGKLGIVIWVMLVCITGALAFGFGHGVRGFGHHGHGHMGGWGWVCNEQMSPGWHGMRQGFKFDADPDGYPGVFGRMMSQLPESLTVEQSRKAEQLLDEAEKTYRKQLQQRWDAHDKLQKLYQGDKRDWNAIRDATLALADLQGQQMKSMVELQQQIDNLLSDEQKRENTRPWRGYGW